MSIKRRKSRCVSVRGVRIGGTAPISVQSMTKLPITDVRGTVNQIERLVRSGCDIVRLAVLDAEALEYFAGIRREVSVPMVADIHFDYRLALGSIKAGADKLRINPGNLGGRQKLHEVASAAKDHGLPIRVGVNGGSLEKDLLERFSGPTAEAIAESALRNAGLLSDVGFEDIVVSAKSSSVHTTIKAYREIAGRCDFPLHLGVTETGPGEMGLVKSAIGIGALLSDGVGDTIRVSLTGAPENEVSAGHMILRSLSIGRPHVDLVSCPTCGRTRGPLIALAERVKQAVSGFGIDLTIAVMGCEVNGPGEAREADFGIALTRTGAVLFEKGNVLHSGAADDLIDEMIKKISTLADERTVADVEER